MLGLILQALISAVILGNIYALIALGLNLVFGVMGIPNFAHCQYMVLAMYGVYWLWSIFNIDPYLSSFIIVPLLFCGGFVTQRFIIKRVLGMSATNQIILLCGLYTFLCSLTSLLFTEKYRSIVTPYLYLSLNLGGFYVGLPHLIAFIVSLVLVLALHLFLTRTDFGRVIRATSEDLEGASMYGVNVYKVFEIVFGIGTALVGVAGLLIAPIYSIYPRVGDPFLVSSFIIVVLGGLGSFKGCLIASYVIALTECLVAALFNPAFRLLGSLILFLIILLFKPTGIFGAR